VLVDQPEREAHVVVLDQRGRAPVGDDRGVVTGDELVDDRQRRGDVGILVMAHEPSDRVEGHDLGHLAADLGKRQAATGIEEHRLIAVLEEVHVALEGVAGHKAAHPPDPVGDLVRVIELVRRGSAPVAHAGERTTTLRPPHGPEVPK